MELAQDKIDLIGEIVRKDRKYTGNEDLYEDFLNEACTKALSVVDSISNDDTLAIYLRKIVSTSILTVLKTSGRLRRSKSGYVSTEEVSIDSEPSKTNETSYSPVFSNNISRYSNIKIPETPESIAIQNDMVQFVSSAIKQIDQNFPEEKYIDIYRLRYKNGYTQKEIANELGISQSEVSKRLYALMDKVKEVMD